MTSLVTRGVLLLEPIGAGTFFLPYEFGLARVPTAFAALERLPVVLLMSLPPPPSPVALELHPLPLCDDARTTSTVVAGFIGGGAERQAQKHTRERKTEIQYQGIRRKTADESNEVNGLPRPSRFSGCKLHMSRERAGEA